MKILQINTFSYKAAGNIMMNIHKQLLSLGIDSYVAWGRGRESQNSHEYYMNENIEMKIHGIYTRITDKHGFGSLLATKRLLKWIDNIQPDIIHLHCIHGYYINIKLLFSYICKHNIKVIWTQHDCWSFTGHCAYFDACNCEKWKYECNNCPQKRTYPASVFLDNSQFNWNAKKEIFKDCNITLVTPCNWLNNIIKDSFLSIYPCITIYNGIDIEIFKKQDSDFKKKYKIENKKIILGVASEWTKRKGLADFLKMASILTDEYCIVLIGLSKKQLKLLPQNIIGFSRTENVNELVSIYNSADVYFNPTYEDNFPTTNIEAIACGTPVVTYRTGGCEEALLNEKYGVAVNKGDLNSALLEIKRLTNSSNRNTLDNKLFNFSKEYMIQSYIYLYERTLL